MHWVLSLLGYLNSAIQVYHPSQNPAVIKSPSYRIVVNFFFMIPPLEQPVESFGVLPYGELGISFTSDTAFQSLRVKFFNRPAVFADYATY